MTAEQAGNSCGENQRRSCANMQTSDTDLETYENEVFRSCAIGGAQIHANEYLVYVGSMFNVFDLQSGKFNSRDVNDVVLI